MREYTAPGKPGATKCRLVVLPGKVRRGVLEAAHNAVLGHWGTQKTRDSVLSNFYWPGIQRDVRRYCQSCVVCKCTEGVT